MPPKINKIKSRTIRVPRNRNLRLLKATCRSDDCRIGKVTIRLVVRNKVLISRASFSSKNRARFSSKKFAMNQVRVVSIRLPKRAYTMLRARKSGAVSVSILTASANGETRRAGLRNGLRR